MAIRNRKLGTDSRGRYKVDVGFKVTAGGKLARHRFLLGTDQAIAERSAARLKQFWQRCEEVSRERTHLCGYFIELERGQWVSFTLDIANQIAKGANVITLPMEHGWPQFYATVYTRVCDTFPFLCFAPPTSKEEDLELGQRLNAEAVERTAERTLDRFRHTGMLSHRKGRTGYTLHQALDTYADHVEATGVRDEHGTLKPSQGNRLERVKRFKTAHEDVALSSIDLAAISEMVAYWRNRPETQKGTRSSRHDIRHVLSELFRFFRWLECVEKFKWSLPKGFASINRAIPKFDSERKVSAMTKTTYTVEQLATINQHATPLQRLMLYVGLNCSMGAAELGRLRLDDFALGQPHPFADRLHFTTFANDNFVRVLRPKTDVFGEWRLWMPVVEIVRWGIDRAQAAESELLLCYSSGLPIYGRSKNAQQGVANLWTELLDRVQQSDSSFPRLPFGTIRDTFADLIRHKRSGELASLQLCHGSPVATDVLLECYSNKPFGSLHTATAELFEVYRPIFDAVTDPTDAKKKFWSPSLVERMRSERASGRAVRLIAEDLGVCEMTVRRHTV